MDDVHHLAVEACPAAMIMVGANGTIELVNAECERMFGYERAGLIGSTIEKLVPEKARADHRTLRASFVGEPSRRLMGIGHDYRAVRSDGSEFPVEIGLTPINIPSGQGVLAFVVDITARREAQKTISGHIAELERVNEGLAHFASIASHDIQEPLRKIVAFADILKTAITDANMDEVAYAGGVMQVSARHARRLVADLLSFARAVNAEYALEPLSMREVVDGALLDLSQTILDENAVLEVNVEDFTITADRTQTILLVQNLVSNALKYHEAGKRPIVRISADARPHSARRLSIADEGIGFPIARLEDIFEPFKRLHSRDKYPGSGIGLAICKTVASRHGWSIIAESAPMCGSRFDVLLGMSELLHSRRAARNASIGSRRRKLEKTADA